MALYTRDSPLKGIGTASAEAVQAYSDAERFGWSVESVTLGTTLTTTSAFMPDGRGAALHATRVMDRPSSKRLMKFGMSRSRHYLQVVRSVVRAVFVNVMHDFVLAQRTTDHLFGNKAMFVYPAFTARMIHDHVTHRHTTWAEIIVSALEPISGIAARHRTEHPRRRVTRLYPEVRTAQWAGFLNACGAVAANASSVKARTIAIFCGRLPGVDNTECLTALLADETYARPGFATLGAHRNQPFRCHSGGVTNTARFSYSQANFTMIGGY